VFCFCFCFDSLQPMSLFGTETPSTTRAFEEAFDTLPELTQQTRAMAAPIATPQLKSEVSFAHSARALTARATS
jgi:hypothetical protein